MRTEGIILEWVLIMLQQELVLQVLLMDGRCAFAFVLHTELVFTFSAKSSVNPKSFSASHVVRVLSHYKCDLR